MKISLPVVPPFSFDQTLAFLASFPPCRGDYELGPGRVTAAIAVNGRAHAYTLSGTGDRVTLEVADDAPVAAIAAAASDLVGAQDHLATFYATAAADPDFAPIVRELWGLHHVRFSSLADIAVYSVMMQRNPMPRAGAMRRAFLERFGLRAGHLRAMPELAAIAELSGEAIGEAIGHRRKGEQIALVARGVAALGEAFLRSAPYEVARDALLEIPHVGPFSAAAILLRGLGRMDELPWMSQFSSRAEQVYGRIDEATIRTRYGRWIGYWSFYLMVTDSGRTSASARSPRSGASAGRAAPRRSRGTSRGPSSFRAASRPA